MNKAIFKKFIIRILVGIGIAFGVLFAAGIGSIIYMSYRNPRDPIYQTDMTGFELLVQSGRDADSRAAMQRELQRSVGKFKLETLRCFPVFRTVLNMKNWCVDYQ